MNYCVGFLRAGLMLVVSCVLYRRGGGKERDSLLFLCDVMSDRV